MNEIENLIAMITVILNFLSSLLWPAVVLIIVHVFRQQIANLITSIKKIKVSEYELEIGDKVVAPAPVVKTYPTIPPVMEKEQPAKISRLSDEEIEQSRQRALKRLEEDTQRAGYQRGKLFQLDNGKWAIAWEANASVKIGIKTS